jgi:hypothetical protein
MKKALQSLTLELALLAGVRTASAGQVEFQRLNYTVITP